MDEMDKRLVEPQVGQQNEAQIEQSG